MGKRTAPNRSTEASCFVRMTQAERDLMERAAGRVLQDAGLNVKVTLGKFLLASGVKEARRILGEK